MPGSAEPLAPPPEVRSARTGLWRGTGPLWRGTRPLRTRPLGQAGAVFAWLILVVTLAQDLLYPALRGTLHSRWALAGVQLGVYLLLAAPVLLWSPRTLKLLRAPAWQVGLGVLAVAATLAYRATGHQAGAARLGYLAVTLAPAAFIEEYLFRGFIWDRCREAGLGLVLVVAVNAVAFAALHLPTALNDQATATELARDLCLGLVLCLVRLWSGNITLPGLLHTAWDISGGF